MSGMRTTGKHEDAKNQQTNIPHTITIVRPTGQQHGGKGGDGYGTWIGNIYTEAESDGVCCGSSEGE